MKVLVTGDRNWYDYNLIRDALSALVLEGYTELIEGEARGVDRLAARAGEAIGMNVIRVPAEWHLYGRSAGPIRNQEMLKKQPDLVMAFHDDLPNSKGTKHMVGIARKAGVPVRHVTH